MATAVLLAPREGGLMVRSSSHRRVALIAALLSLAVPLATGLPAQALGNPPSGWLSALVHQMTRWLPADLWPSQKEPAGLNAPRQGEKRALQKAATINCYTPTSDPDGGCPAGNSRRGSSTNTCYTGSIDPDGRCQ